LHPTAQIYFQCPARDPKSTQSVPIRACVFICGQPFCQSEILSHQFLVGVANTIDSGDANCWKALDVIDDKTCARLVSDALQVHGRRFWFPSVLNVHPELPWMADRDIFAVEPCNAIGDADWHCLPPSMR
jgi:hypothetical protein